MKKILKYIIAVIMLASVGIGSMTLVSAGAVRLSAFHMIKLGTIEKEEGGILSELFDTFFSYIRDYAYILLVLMGVIVLVAVLTAALPVKAAYIVSIAGQIVINISAGILYVQLRRRITAVQSMIEGAKGFFGIGGMSEIGRIEIHNLPVVLWTALYLLALLLAVAGIAAKEKKAVQMPPKDIMPENIRMGGNAYLDRIQELEANRKRQVQAPPAGREEAFRAAPEKEPSPQVMAKGQPEQGFEGALRGESGIYASQVYPMKERVPVYFGRDSQKRLMIMEQKNMQEVEAEVYYVAEYQEYCVKPMRKLAVFLESGQPLGAGREYRLPRGMKICMVGKEEVFTLT